jgi:hypothetical protein
VHGSPGECGWPQLEQMGVGPRVLGSVGVKKAYLMGPR